MSRLTSGYGVTAEMITAHHKLRLRLRRSGRSRRRTAKAAQMVLEAARKQNMNEKKALEDDSICICIHFGVTFIKILILILIEHLLKPLRRGEATWQR